MTTLAWNASAVCCTSTRKADAECPFAQRDTSGLERLLSEALLQHGPGRAQTLRFAARGLARAVAVVPGIHVHVHPGLRFGHEALQVQRGRDAAGHARRPAVGEVGDGAQEI